jgi:ADP-ribose pyrophosphatase
MADWKKIKQEPGYQGKWVQTVFKTFQLPSGHEHVFEIVPGIDCVFILALTENNEVILERQFRPGPEKELLELPAGIIDHVGEDALATAKRELLEETGYTGDFQLIQDNFYSSAYREHKFSLFAATHCHKVQETSFDTGEYLETVLMPLPAFRERIKQADSVTLAMAYIALDRLNLL